jgi:hypothetical protein
MVGNVTPIVVPEVEVGPAPPPDPVITQSALENYLKKSTLWCADGTCKFGSITIPEADAGRAIQSAIFDKMMHNYMYPPNGATIYHDIVEAKTKKVVEKIGNPKDYNDEAYTPPKAPWNGRAIINYGTGVNPDKNGMLVHVPADAEVVWIRFLNDRWQVPKVTIASTNEKIGRFASGHRNIANYTPDGTMGNDGHWNFHVWMPIPLPRTSIGDIIVTGSGGSADLWLSGIAFSKNPWKHAMNSALAYHWNINTPGVADDQVLNDAAKNGIYWETHNWNNDQLVRIQNNGPGGKAIFYVPVVPSGKDKLVYMVEHNNNWLGTGHTDLSANDKPIERFRSTYDNPFARNFNSKLYMRYIAAKIPAGYISPTDKFVKITLNMTGTNHNIYIREMGTHDLFPDLPNI